MKTYNLTDDQRKYLTVVDKAIEEAKLKGSCSPYANSLIKFYEAIGDLTDGKTGKLVFFVPHTIITKQTMVQGDLRFKTDDPKQLYDTQKELLSIVNEKMQEANGCIISAPPGFGKTKVMIEIIKSKLQPTLIVVPNKELMKQTKERLLDAFYEEDIGFYGNGKKQWGKPILICTVQSLIKIDDLLLEKGEYPVVFLDECHKCIGESTIHSLLHLSCVEMYGLSATPYTNRFNAYSVSVLFGEIIEYGRKQIIPDVYYVEYKSNYLLSPDSYTKERAEIFDDDYERLDKQAEIIKGLKNKHNRKHILVLYDRVKHSTYMQGKLKEILGIENIYLLNGTLNNDDRKINLDGFKADGGILVASDSIAGTGFDVPAIDTVCLFFPNKFDGRIIQMVGRALRDSEGKQGAWVVDFYDTCFRYQFRKRREVYAKVYNKQAILLDSPIVDIEIDITNIF